METTTRVCQFCSPYGTPKPATDTADDGRPICGSCKASHKLNVALTDRHVAIKQRNMLGTVLLMLFVLWLAVRLGQL